MPRTTPKVLSSKALSFPDVKNALNEPDGLLAIGGDLSFQRLLVAYRQGIFPWYDIHSPLLWWSPSVRCIYSLSNPIQIPKSLRKKISKQKFDVRFDTAFIEVIEACAKTRNEGTWIHPDMIKAYTTLFHNGYAHSVEVWIDEKLVGGLYGVSLGRAFFGESMFHRVTDCSKIAFYALCFQLKDWQFDFIDGQLSNPHLHRLGFVDISREAFLIRLKQSLNEKTLTGPWHYQNAMP